YQLLTAHAQREGFLVPGPDNIDVLVTTERPRRKAQVVLVFGERVPGEAEERLAGPFVADRRLDELQLFGMSDATLLEKRRINHRLAALKRLDELFILLNDVR